MRPARRSFTDRHISPRHSSAPPNPQRPPRAAPCQAASRMSSRAQRASRSKLRRDRLTISTAPSAFRYSICTSLSKPAPIIRSATVILYAAYQS